MVGGPGRNRTGIRGFAVRCITTLPPDPRWLRALCRAGRRAVKGRAGRLAVKGGLAAFSHLPRASVVLRVLRVENPSWRPHPRHGVMREPNGHGSRPPHARPDLPLLLSPPAHPHCGRRDGPV